MTPILINSEGIHAQLPDGKLVRFEDQEGTRKLLLGEWSWGKKLEDGTHQIPAGYEIVTQWQYDKGNYWHTCGPDPGHKNYSNEGYETRQVAILKKKTVASDSSVTLSNVETGEERIDDLAFEYERQTYYSHTLGNDPSYHFKNGYLKAMDEHASLKQSSSEYNKALEDAAKRLYLTLQGTGLRWPNILEALVQYEKLKESTPPKG